MTHPSEAAATVVISVVALVSLALFFVAAMAARRSGNTRLWFVAGAFALLATKGIIVATSVPTQAIGHEDLELVSSLFDLGVVILLVIPILRR